MNSTKVADGEVQYAEYKLPEELAMAADPVIQYMTDEQLDKSIKHTRKQMEAAAKDLDFMEAARLRDEVYALENHKKKSKK